MIVLRRHRSGQVFALDRAGKTREAIAKEVGISLVSVYRILRTRKDAEKAPVASLGIIIIGDVPAKTEKRLADKERPAA